MASNDVLKYCPICAKPLLENRKCILDCVWPPNGCMRYIVDTKEPAFLEKDGKVMYNTSLLKERGLLNEYVPVFACPTKLSVSVC